MRLAACLLMGVLAAQFAYGAATYALSSPSKQHRDFGQAWFAARLVSQGVDPYGAIGPGRAFEWPAPFFYPLPAAIAALPLAPFTEPVAVAIFSAIAATLLAWALTQHGYSGLLAFGSVSVWTAFLVVQWSPLLAAAVVLAPVGVLLIAKPTIGAALFVARPSWWAVAGATLLLGAAFIAQPNWISAWREALGGASMDASRGFPYVAPISLPGGVLTLLALLRWRRPEARLVAAMACVPQTLVLYEAVPLFLVARGWRQTSLLVALSYCVRYWIAQNGPYPDYATPIAVSGRAMTILMYLPATAMVLLRPNEGTIPRKWESALQRLPSWLRGRDASAA